MMPSSGESASAFKQCAAVSTTVGVRSVPPQRCDPSVRMRRRQTANGYWVAGSVACEAAAARAFNN